MIDQPCVQIHPATEVGDFFGQEVKTIIAKTLKLFVTSYPKGYRFA